MKLHQLPTRSLRELAARCEGLNAVLGDHRVALSAVTTACYREIQLRVEGKDFPEATAEAAAEFTALIRSGPAEFARAIFEVDE